MHERSRVRRCGAAGSVPGRFIASPALIASPRSLPGPVRIFTRNLPRTPPPLSPRSLNPLIAGACLAALVALGTVPAAALAQAGGVIAERRSDLDELKQRIRELQDEMAKAEAERSTAQKALVESERAVSRAMDLTPRGIREHLDLCRPIYRRTAAYGHFGRAPQEDGGFSWERTDLAQAILREL